MGNETVKMLSSLLTWLNKSFRTKLKPFTTEGIIRRFNRSYIRMFTALTEFLRCFMVFILFAQYDKDVAELGLGTFASMQYSAASRANIARVIIALALNQN